MAKEAKKSVLEVIAETMAKAADKVDEFIPGAKTRHENLAKQSGAGAEFTALGREIAKDLQQTFHEIAYGKSMHGAEPGTPFNPTMQLITEELKGKDVDPKTDMIAKDAPKKETTLSQMRGYADAKAQQVYEKMGHDQSKDQEKDKEHGIEM